MSRLYINHKDGFKEQFKLEINYNSGWSSIDRSIDHAKIVIAEYHVKQLLSALFNEKADGVEMFISK